MGLTASRTPPRGSAPKGMHPPAGPDPSPVSLPRGNEGALPGGVQRPGPREMLPPPLGAGRSLQRLPDLGREGTAWSTNTARGLPEAPGAGPLLFAQEILCPTGHSLVHTYFLSARPCPGWGLRPSVEHILAFKEALQRHTRSDQALRGNQTQDAEQQSWANTSLVGHVLTPTEAQRRPGPLHRSDRTFWSPGPLPGPAGPCPSSASLLSTPRPERTPRSREYKRLLPGEPGCGCHSEPESGCLGVDGGGGTQGR